MDVEQRLQELVETWEDLEEGGSPPDLTELCRDSPELWQALQARIEVLRHFARLRMPEEEVDSLTTDDQAETQTEAPLPKSIGGYPIVRLQGKGGMGAVYEAVDALGQRRLAIKVTRSEKEDHPDFRERFLREARAAAGLHHEHIIPIFQVGEDEGRLFLVMPLLPGETLQDRLGRAARMPWREAVRIGREVAEGLSAAHEKGLIHRDIKPGNIWLEERGQDPRSGGQVRLLDFGLARPVADAEGPTQTGAVLGTPSYMAPEQADGNPLDERADLYSLGCVLYLMSTGRKAFLGQTIPAVLRAQATQDPPPVHEICPEVPLALSELIGRLLARDRDQRPGSAREVIETLREIEADEPPSATTSLPAPSRSRSRLFTPGRVLAAACLIVLLAAGWGVKQLLSLPGKGPEQQEQVQTAPPPAQEPLKITSLDIGLWKRGNLSRRLTLSDTRALPMQPGDYVRYEVTLNRPGYIYILYVDAMGEVSPLYPWRGYDWNDRPETEMPTGKLYLPEDPLADGAPLTAGPSGIEAVIVLASEDSILGEEASRLPELLGGKPPAAVFNPLAGAVWLNTEGVHFQVAADRARPDFDKSRRVEDPVQRIRRLVRSPDLQRLGAVKGVCYPFSGK